MLQELQKINGNRLTLKNSTALRISFQERKIINGLPNEWENFTPNRNGIGVYRTLPIDGVETECRCILTIDKTLLGFNVKKIARLKIKLMLDSNFNNTGVANLTGDGMISFISDKPVYMDLTEQLCYDEQSATGYIEAYQNNTDISLLDPIIEIEYVSEEDERVFKTEVDMLDGVSGRLVMANGEFFTTVNSIKPENSVMGIDISQTFRQDAGNTAVGKNVFLSLNEKFEKNAAAYLDVDYIYTDGKGDKHGFKEYFYRMNGSQKEYLAVNKSEIEISADGTLSYDGGTVFSEYLSPTGLKAATQSEGFSGNNLIEQRTDELKQTEEKIKSYRNAVKDFVLMSTSDGFYNDTELTESQIFANYPDGQMLIPESEAMQYRALKQQYATLTATSESSEIVPNEPNINMQLASMRSSIYELTLTLRNYIYNCTYKDSDMVAKNYILDRLDANEIVPKSSYDLLADIYAKYVEFPNTDIPYTGGAALKVKFRQRNLLLEQYKQLNGGYYTYASGSLLEQINLVKAQIDYIVSKKEIYAEQIKTYYKEYSNAVAEKTKIKLQLPVSYLTDGKTIKGFNEAGALVAVYDRNENYAVIEYESYCMDSVAGYRIKRLYDNTEKQVRFTYNAANLLSQITDTRGMKVTYAYSSANTLEAIKYDADKELVFEYDDNDIIRITDDKAKKSVEITYDTNERVTKVERYSLASDIGGETPRDSKELLDRLSITYDVTTNSAAVCNEILNYDGSTDRYYLNGNGFLTEWWKIENNYVADSMRYEYVPYFKYGIKQENPREVVKRDFDYSYGSDSPSMYVFTCGETETVTFNQFNKPESKTHYYPITSDADTDYVATITYYTYSYFILWTLSK